MEDCLMTEYILEEYGNNLLAYFERLRHLGASKPCEPIRLFIAGYIDELLSSGMSTFITEEDYLVIDKALNCLMGVCVLPFHEWQHSTDINSTFMLEEGTPITNEAITYVLSPEMYSQVYITE